MHFQKGEYPNEFKTLQRQLNRAFEPFLGRFYAEEDLASGTWVPPVDVCEEPDRLLVRAEVPGMKLNAIDIQFAEGTLVLKGERQLEKESAERKYQRLERPYGSFVRSFTLPRTVDPERISATYTDGILEISVPKREEMKPRQIRIEVKQ